MPHIALLLPLTHGFHEQVLMGIASATRDRPSWIFRQFDPDDAELEALQEWRPDGIITSGPRGTVAAFLATLGVPMVNVSRVKGAPGLPFVANDNAAIGLMGASHFLELGFRHGAFLGWPTLDFAKERAAAFRTAMTAAGASCVIYDPGPEYDPRAWAKHHARSDRHLLGWLRGLPTPCGLLVATDQLAWRAAELCRQEGLRIPDDIALLGVDDDQTICRLTRPALSSIQVDAPRIGEEAVTMLEGMLKGRAGATRLRVPPRGISVRASTDRVAIEDPLLREAIAFINGQASGPLTVPAVVAHVGTSRRTLERRFRLILRRGILDEIHRVRLFRARTLIGAGGMTTRDIAAHSGFGHVSTLHRALNRDRP